MNGPILKKDLVLTFGDKDDGVIGIPAVTHDGRVIEISYFFGKSRPKNIIVISSQAGCPMRCAFCELGSERYARNLTAEEIRAQADLMLEEAALRGFDVAATPHKITVANSGEPLLNPRLVDGLERLREVPASFKVSTVLPDSKIAENVLGRLADFSSGLDRPLQLQISLISTSETERSRMSGGRVAGFRQIREAAAKWQAKHADGRKVNLSLMLTADMSCDAAAIAAIFPAELFRFRFREYVPTRHGSGNGLKKIDSERLTSVKDAFRERGYEVYDWATPSPTEWKFGLAGNVIRRMYLDMIGSRK